MQIALLKLRVSRFEQEKKSQRPPPFRRQSAPIYRIY